MFLKHSSGAWVCPNCGTRNASGNKCICGYIKPKS